MAPDGIVANFSSREDPHHIVGRKAPMARLASYLTRMLQVPVMDQTGLARDFNFELTWESDDPPLASRRSRVGRGCAPGTARGSNWINASVRSRYWWWTTSKNRRKIDGAAAMLPFQYKILTGAGSF